MNFRRVLPFAALLSALAGCETTGDPRAGGLFGWSEAKALDRQAEKRAGVAGAERRVTSETQRSAALQRRGATVERRIRSEGAQVRHESAALERQYAITRQTAALLEEDSPTAATASRARVWQQRVDSVARDRALSPSARRERLRMINSELEAARRALAR